MSETENKSYHKLLADAEIMALRLLGEDENTFSPECFEVMTRWKKHITAKYFIALTENHETP